MGNKEIIHNKQDKNNIKKRMSYLLYYLFKDKVSPYLSKSIKGEFDKRTLHFTKGE